MAEHEVKNGTQEARSVSTLPLLYVAALAAAAILLFRPRPVPPGEGLLMPDGAVGAQAEISEALRATLESRDGQRVIDTFRLAAAAEASVREGTLHSDERYRRHEAAEAVAAFAQAHGEAALAALRREMALAWTRTFLRREESPELGAFPEHLARYGVHRDQLRTLSLGDTVVLALAKARWNAMGKRDLLEGLSQGEARAYWGWLAFHAHGAAADRRLTALEAFEAAGGAPADELRALLLARLGDPLAAANGMDAAYQQTHNLRLRNHALAFIHMTNAEDTAAP